MTNTEVTPETCTHLNAKIAFTEEHKFEVDFADGEINDHSDYYEGLDLYFDFYCFDCNHTATYNRIAKTVPQAIMDRFNEDEEHHRFR